LNSIDKLKQLIGGQKKNERTTLVLLQAGLDVETSAVCIAVLLFRQTNNYQLLYLTSSTYFQSAAVVGRRNTISQPAQSPARYAKSFTPLLMFKFK